MAGSKDKRKFGVLPVFLTSVSSILGAVLFLRLGYATGMLGFWGVITVIILGHLITIPTALAVSELATNSRVEGGGEYFIISRSLGMKVGATIGITLFMSQAISIAFYTIAFAESFQPLYEWWAARFGWELPRQAVTVPTLLILAWIMLKKGAGSGVSMLYAVVGMIFLSLLMFFLGSPLVGQTAEWTIDESGMVIATTSAVDFGNFGFFNADSFFIIFAICFPAFTGMTAGVGLSGELRDPGRAIPIGTILGTLAGFVVYTLVVFKLAVSAPQETLVGDQLVMARIALYGDFVIPLGLAASTLSSAIGMMLVAPRTLQAIAGDRVFPFRRLNVFLARNKGPLREPRNASLISFTLALIFILLGDVDSVAQIISMFFLISYGTLCLSSFLNHFGAPPSYRPRFRSKWYVSLAGFILSVWVMFRISAVYTIGSYVIITLIYTYVEHLNKDKRGIVSIFKGALFQINRRLQVYMQKSQSDIVRDDWRPAAVCISADSFKRDKALGMMRWIGYRHGFGTYFHLVEGYYDGDTCRMAHEAQKRLVETQKDKRGALYIDTMISPSYTSAIAQVIQTPSISGMENNMVLFEYAADDTAGLRRILDNIELVKAGDFDVCILCSSAAKAGSSGGLHIWITDVNDVNTNLMILLGYIIMSHPDWHRERIQLFLAVGGWSDPEAGRLLRERVEAGRLPVSMSRVEIVEIGPDGTFEAAVAEHSGGAALTLIGFHDSDLTADADGYFSRFAGHGDILFVNAAAPKEI